MIARQRASTMPFDGVDFAGLIGQAARKLLGEPNRELSSRDELRFGSRGSLAVRIGGEKRGTWFDHEANEGGGVLDLLRCKARLVNGAALDWLRQELGADIGQERPRVARLGSIVAAYDYRVPNGDLVFQVTRHDPKDFRQRRPDGTGGWIWGMKGVDLVPYRLPELLTAPGAEPVFIPEGEKDVDRLRALGLVATCNPGGAGKWKPTFAAWLRGRDVIVLPDNDDAGRDHAAGVVRMLAKAAVRLRIVELPNLPHKGDVSDWLAAGGTREELLRLAGAAPAAQPPASRREAPAVDLRDVELTENGVALTFEERHRDQLRYCHDTGGWYVWTGAHWQQNRDGLAFTWARDLVRGLNRTAEFKTKAIAGKAAFAGAVEKFAQRARAFAVTAEAWDSDAFLLGTPGGVVNLRTGALHPARREDHITKQTAVAPAPAGSTCDAWLTFLDQATAKDDALIRFLQQWAGYCLTGSTLEHALLFIYGPGGNGKSVFLNTVSRILGVDRHGKRTPVRGRSASNRPPLGDGVHGGSRDGRELRRGCWLWRRWRGSVGCTSCRASRSRRSAGSWAFRGKWCARCCGLGRPSSAMPGRASQCRGLGHGRGSSMSCWRRMRRDRAVSG
jgi:putative DNA primase/helicase